MRDWSPEIRYSVEELIAGLQLEITENGRYKRQGRGQKQEQLTGDDPVWIPRPIENAVLGALRKHNVFIRRHLARGSMTFPALGSLSTRARLIAARPTSNPMTFGLLAASSVCMATVLTGISENC
jgi:hypothetical protein